LCAKDTYFTRSGALALCCLAILLTDLRDSFLNASDRVYSRAKIVVDIILPPF